MMLLHNLLIEPTSLFTLNRNHGSDWAGVSDRKFLRERRTNLSYWQMVSTPPPPMLNYNSCVNSANLTIVDIALSVEGNPSFVTVLKVATALGLKISIHPA